MGDKCTYKIQDANTNKMSQVLVVFYVFLSLFLALTYSQGTFLLLSYLIKAGEKKKAQRKCNLSLRRFKASFSFFTSETPVRSGWGDKREDQQLKMQIGETGRVR